MRNLYLVTDDFIVARIRKEEDEVITLTLDYTKLLSRLSSDTISTSTWTDDASHITFDSESETTTQTTATLSGGNGGNTAIAENTVVTAGGLTIKKALQVKIVEIGTPTLDYE